MYTFFLACIILSPLPFGSNRPWSWSLYAFLFGLIGFVYFVQALLGRRQLISFPVINVSIFLFCVPVAWAILQTSNPLVSNWANSFWQLTEKSLNIPIQSHISVGPQQSWTALMRLLSYGIVFLLSLQFNLNHDRAVLTFKALAYTGFVYALYGIIIQLGNFNMILWFEKEPNNYFVTSTFINRNSYATYAGLTFLTCIPLLFNLFKSSLKFGLNNNYGRQYFYKKLFIRGWLTILATFTLITALLMSQSRGGFLSTFAAIIGLTIVLMVSNKVNVKRDLLLTLIILVPFIVCIMLSQNLYIILDRINVIVIGTDGRSLVYDLVANASLKNKWLGVGYGTFEHSFRLYRDESINGFYDKAHNTYLENIFELGWPQACSLFLSIMWLAGICLRGIWLRKHNWIYPSVGFACSILVGAHAFVDFSLQIPAVAYTYALILGASVAQSFSSRRVSH